MTPQDLHTLLRHQDGLMTRAQLFDLGFSTSAIDRRLASGDWDRVHPRVYRAVAHLWPPRARPRAVGLWLPDGGTLTGRAAAFWWRLTDALPPVVTVAIPPPGRRPAPPGLALARRVLPTGQRVRVDGLWVTGRALTVLEAAVEMGLVEGARLMDRALLRARVSLAGLHSALAMTAGRDGTTAARRLLALADGGARSEAERVASAGWAMPASV